MMQGDDPRDGDPGRDAAAELEALAEDWIALWQSEIAGLAADREAAEGWAAMTAIWSALGAAWLRAAASPPFGRPPPGGVPNPFGMPAWPGPAHDGTADRAATPPRPAPAAAAPDPGGKPRDGRDPERGDAALAARLAGLERRLAALEPGDAPVPGGAGGDAKDRRRPRRRKPAG
ncbi:hypothetical protein [Falsiroseomonas sp. E2-1-a4]|uniref:hypothetical protein n=1 Tax=Falsiroseomonas sp. E2-1-a4 TaxID=3239299 RepID=UPI003F2B21A9